MVDKSTYLSHLKSAVDHLEESVGSAPRTALILGSGLGGFVDDYPEKKAIPYGDIPHFPVSTVVGHEGQLVVATQDSRRFCVLKGRVHLYEGVPACMVVFAVRALALWGVSRFVITNAAGAVNTGFSVGELMLISDHINLTGANPLTGPNLDELGPRFPDLTRAYDPGLRRLALQCAERLGMTLQQGVYVALAGPSYETPAEIRMCRALGADAVGMSTVPEVIALNHMKRKVLGISCLTNMAAGIRDEKMDHREVLETTDRVRESFSRLLACLLGAME